MSILISVIIPTYNRVDLLRQTLDSLGSPDARDREVIVVDDGSTDGTRAFLESRPGLSWYGQENAGPSTARNLGASKATGEYLAFLDSDDLWFPWTESVYRQVIGKTHAAFIAGKPFLFEDPQSLSGVPQSPTSYLEFADYLESGNEWRWWGCSSFVMERAAFLAAGGFTGKRINAEDIDLTLRMGTAPGQRDEEPGPQSPRHRTRPGDPESGRLSRLPGPLRGTVADSHPPPAAGRAFCPALGQPPAGLENLPGHPALPPA